MAIDTRNKRSSAINVGSPWRGMLPLPDGTIDQADRQHAALHYSGILASVLFPAVPLNIVAASGVSGAADTSYFIKIYDPYGNAMPDTGALWRVEVAQAVGVVGSVTFSIPGDYPEEYLKLDGLIEVYRAPRNRAPYLLFNKVFFLRRWTRIFSKGHRSWKCTAYDPNYLLGSPSGQTGRIVAYAATSAQAMQTDFADDMLKAIMRQNIGALATDTARDLSAYLTIQADSSDAPSISKEFSNRVLVPVLNEISQASWTAGVYLTWDIELITPPHKGAFKLEFRTYINQRGEDHRGSTASRVIVGTDDGSMDDVEVDYDFTEEVNYIRAGGQDNGSIRIYQSGGNVTAIAKSPFNRRETFLNLQNIASPTTLQNEIDWALKAGVPEPYFSGTLTVEGQAGFDSTWAYGDYVTAQADGHGFDARVAGVTINFDRDGGETIKPYLNGYNPSPGHPLDELSGNGSMKSLANSIAVLQKRVTGLGYRQEFIRPFEVVNSGLLPPPSVAAIIGLFDVACPAGWTEYTAAQGRTIVGVPAGGTVGGTVGSALADLATRTISTVVAHLHAFGTLANAAEAAHTHGVGTYDAAAEASHTHAAGSLDAAAEAAHTHGVGTYNNASEAAHTHGVGSYDAAAESSHTHGVGTYNNASESAHTHGVGSYDAAAEAAHTHTDGSLVNSAESAHIHSIDPPNTSSALEAQDHTHQVDPPSTATDSLGAHTHAVRGNDAVAGSQVYLSLTGDSVIATNDIAGAALSSGAHIHNVNISTFNTGGISAQHTHGVNIAAFDSAAGSSHNHTITGTTSAGSSHDHALSGTSGAGSSHDHAISGSSAAGSSHDHAISGSSGTGSSHDHAISGSSAAGSSHDHVISGSVGAGSSHDHALSGNSGAGSSHNHSLSGSVASTGTATVDVTMPYIQLRLCQKT